MSTKYNYWCINCVCGLKGKERDFVIEGVDDNKEQQKTEINCPNSPEENADVLLKLMGINLNTSGGYLKFNGLSKESKRAMLKKRATEHFKKEIEPQKEQKWKELRKEMSGK